MSWEAWFTLAVVLGTFYVLARDLYSPAMTVVSAAIVLLLAGVIDAEQAFAGFSNTAPITVAALYVLAAAVDRTNTMQPVVAITMGRGRNLRVRLLRLLFPSAITSAFLNNTPQVAMLAPQVTTWAERRGEAPSRYLMPLSYAVILGGMTTLIGTSTNLVVSGLLEETGQPGIGMFELGWIAIPVAVVGILFIVVASPLLLPERVTSMRQARENLREFVVNMSVVTAGPLDGQTVEAAGLRSLEGVYLAEIHRGSEIIAPVPPDTVLRGDDQLTFVGRADLVVDVQRTRGLVSSERPHIMEFNQPGHTFFEAVIGEASPLLGRTLKEADFRSRYQAAVVAIHRAGRRVSGKFGEVRLKVGDTLLLLTDPGFGRRWRDRNDFLLVSRVGGAPPVPSSKSWLVGLIGFAVVVVAGAGVMPILQASLAGAVLLVLFGVLTPGEARGAIDFDVLIVIAAAFALGAAMEQSGLAASAAGLITGLFSGLGELGVLFGVLLTTIIVLEMITNNAAAVLMFPIAMNAAGQVGADPRTFALALAVTASASFLTPIGYQTNTMVYGMGGYRFGDFARLGAPLTVLVLAAVLASVAFIY